MKKLRTRTARQDFLAATAAEVLRSWIATDRTVCVNGQDVSVRLKHTGDASYVAYVSDDSRMDSPRRIGSFYTDGKTFWSIAAQ